MEQALSAKNVETYNFNQTIEIWRRRKLRKKELFQIIVHFVFPIINLIRVLQNINSEFDSGLIVKTEALLGHQY